MLRILLGYIPDVSVFFQFSSRSPCCKCLYKQQHIPTAKPLCILVMISQCGNGEFLLALTLLPRSVQANMENQKGKTKKHFTVSSAVHDYANDEVWLAFTSLTIIILLKTG